MTQTSVETGRPCPTCDRPWSSEDFYETSIECRSCKRARSSFNRTLQSRKAAALDRLIDALIRHIDSNHDFLSEAS